MDTQKKIEVSKEAKKFARKYDEAAPYTAFEWGANFGYSLSADRIAVLEKALNSVLSIRDLIECVPPVGAEHKGECLAINNMLKLCETALKTEG